MFEISTKARHAMHDDALARYPEESCGFIVGDDYLAQKNVAAEPRFYFRIAARAWARTLGKGEIRAVVHSHPDDHAEPSEADMRMQQESGVPWGIITTDGNIIGRTVWFGDFLLDEPLVGREFLHGVRDCYSLIRSWYWQERGVKLPEVPRDKGWWDAGQSLYEDGFAAAGFRKLGGSITDAQVGDVFLANVGSRAVNHGGVYIGNSLILHHLTNRLSRHEPITPYLRRITHWLRHDA